MTTRLKANRNPAAIFYLTSLLLVIFGNSWCSALTLGEALNATNLTWISTDDPDNGYTPWFPETSVSHDNQSAVQCGGVNSDFYSDLETTVVGPCTVSFWWKVNTKYTLPELDVDFFYPQSFYTINTNVADNLVWHQSSIFIPEAGEHTLDWSYYGSAGQSVWLDQVAVTPFDPRQLTNWLNMAYVPGATCQAIKSTPDGSVAFVCYFNFPSDGSWLVYCQKDVNGQWSLEKITPANFNSCPDRPSYLPKAGLFYSASGDPVVVAAGYNGGYSGGVYERTTGVWSTRSDSVDDWYFIFDLGMDINYTFDVSPAGSIQELAAFTPRDWFDQTVTNLFCSVLGPDGSSWNTDMVPFVGSSKRRTAMADDPRFFSMVLDQQGKVHAVYVPGFLEYAVDGGAAVYSELWYLTNKRGTWESQRIVAPATNTWGDAGLGASIAIGPNGQPAVASVLIGRAATGSANSAKLLYHELGTNGVWTTTTVSSAPDGYTAGDGAIGTGFAPHLLFDSHGRPHIAFTDFATQHFGDYGQDEFGGNLRHAWRDGTLWKLTTVLKQTDPIRNQFMMPNMVILTNKVVIVGQVRHDTLNSDSTVAATDLSFAYVEFVPKDYSDITSPTISFTAPTQNQQLQTNTCLVLGKAADNQGISSVWIKLNNNDWSMASGTTNWTAWVTLSPGTNVLKAYAVDLVGNFSVTNGESFVYVVSGVLQVRTVGLGTLSPNYSNTFLAIGKNFSMTATAGSGFVATNWTISTNLLGGRITNNATVQFMMTSNLTLQANFADVAKPALTVSAPTAGQKMTNALVTLVGTATDNWRVGGVWYQLNNGAWRLAGTTNGYTNWTQTVTLLTGTNTLKAYAQDWGGNFSTTNTLSVVSSNTFLLQLAFTNAAPLKTNGLVFSLQLSKGLNGRIEVSSNLTSWVTLTNFVGTNAMLNFRDPAATNASQLYYRAVIP